MKSRRISLCVLTLAATLAVGARAANELRSHVEWLSAPAREGRRAGLPGAMESAQYVAAEFQRIGFETQIQEFSGSRRNVIARYGSAPRYILIGAHYDGQGKGNPSASDNAAGVAVILEMAKQLKDGRLPISIVAIAFDDEEQGLNGSLYYVDHPAFPLGDAMAALIFDTLGRPFLDLRAWTTFVLGSESSPELAGILQKRGKPDMLVAGADLIGPRSDFFPFVLKKVPYLFFSDGTHRDYHGPGDTPDRVDYARLDEEARMFIEIARDISELKTRPAFLDQPQYPPGESAALSRVLENLRSERPELPLAYKLMFDDLQPLIKPGADRETYKVAAAAFLALATPRFSPYLLDFELAPYYQKAKKPAIAAAILAEAHEWESSAN